jgi:hypothetical protein
MTFMFQRVKKKMFLQRRIYPQQFINGLSIYSVVTTTYVKYHILVLE